jgi:hypothetical protein
MVVHDAIRQICRVPAEDQKDSPYTANSGPGFHGNPSTEQSNEEKR